MELRDRTAMILGGSGLVGHAVARHVLLLTMPQLIRHIQILVTGALVERDRMLRSHILSVGIAIGERIKP